MLHGVRFENQFSFPLLEAAAIDPELPITLPRSYDKHPFPGPSEKQCDHHSAIGPPGNKEGLLCENFRPSQLKIAPSSSRSSMTSSSSSGM